jgi:hypothetical protein
MSAGKSHDNGGKTSDEDVDHLRSLIAKLLSIPQTESKNISPFKDSKLE